MISDVIGGGISTVCVRLSTIDARVRLSTHNSVSIASATIMTVLKYTSGRVHILCLVLTMSWRHR